MNEHTLNAYTSTITHWLHMKPLKPNSMPATKPLTKQIQFSILRSMFFRSATLSMNMLLPRDTMIVMIPQDEVTFSTNGALPAANTPPGVFVHMMPRRDGIVLGGTSQRGIWTTDIDETERKRVVDAHIQLYDSMK